MANTPNVACPVCGEAMGLVRGGGPRLVACPGCDSLLEVEPEKGPAVRLAEDPLAEDEPDPDDVDTSSEDLGDVDGAGGDPGLGPAGELDDPVDDFLDDEDGDGYEEDD